MFLLNFNEQSLPVSGKSTNQIASFVSHSMSSNQVILGYWAIRGLAQPIRLLLSYTDTDFKDNLYHLKGEAPNWDRSEWFNEKETLGLDFPNLPYLLDGNFKITQSMAILKYIAELHDMCGRNAKERAKLEMVAQEIADCRSKYTGLCYNQKFRELLPNFMVETAAPVLDKFNRYLKSDFLAGDYISYADFLLYEMVQQYSTLSNNMMDKYGNLRNFCTRIEDIPQISTYMETKNFIHSPFNNKQAAWENI